MADELAVMGENSLATFDFGSLYAGVEQNYKVKFSPWRVKLLQKNSPETELAEIGGIVPRAGMFLIGPMDGTGRDRLFEKIRVVLIDYYTGRILNELDDFGKPVEGTNSKRVCGSLDGVVPFFTIETRERCEGAGEPIHVLTRDWRRPELGDIVIDENTACATCPLSFSRFRNEEGKWVAPPCGDYHRVIMYSLDVNQPIEWNIGAFNVLRPIAGRDRVPKGSKPMPGIRKMSYPAAPGEWPPYVRQYSDGPKAHAIVISSDSFQTSNGPIKVPELAYDDEPMSNEAWEQYVSINKMYFELKESYLEDIRNAAPEPGDFEEPQGDQSEAPAPSSGKPAGSARDILGSNSKNRKRRLGTDDEDEADSKGGKSGKDEEDDTL